MGKWQTFIGDLTVDRLRGWAGGKIYSRGKSYIDNVSGLSRMDDGALAAWVSGSEKYATSVGLDPEGEIEYVCTCPYDGGPCKHAVAVVLAAAECVKQKREIPLLTEQDDLFLALFDDSDGADEDAPYVDDDDWTNDGEEAEPAKAVAGARRKEKSPVGKILLKMNKDEMMALLADIAGRYPEIERGILEKEQLATGQVGKVVSSLLREIRALTAEPAYYNHWKGEGNIPDCSHLLEQLQALLDAGHADAVLQLGEELWTLGNEQVGQSHDEGETGSEIAACMEVVLRAVPQTSMTSSNQLLWVIDRMLADEYSLLDSAGELVESKRYASGHWLEVAGVLESRLNSMAKPTAASFSDRYRRGRLVDMLLKAHDRSLRRDKIIPLLEKEADACQCYEKLVDVLLSEGEREKARQWCILGFERTEQSAPGVADSLQKRLRQMAETEKNAGLVAAYRAEDFFKRASRQTYTDLREAAEKAGVWTTVREVGLRYLETGRRPDASGQGKINGSWPLPEPEVIGSVGKTAQRFPDLNVLIDVAILEKRFEDVVTLYGELRKTKRWGFETDKAVAKAVAGTHPEVALGIWRAIVDNLIGQVKPKAYEEAAGYLRQMRKVYLEGNRAGAWQDLLDGLRREHKAKRRLLEVLDALSEKKLVA